MTDTWTEYVPTLLTWGRVKESNSIYSPVRSFTKTKQRNERNEQQARGRWVKEMMQRAAGHVSLMACSPFLSSTRLGHALRWSLLYTCGSVTATPLQHYTTATPDNIVKLCFMNLTYQFSNKPFDAKVVAFIFVIGGLSDNWKKNKYIMLETEEM